jgi:hypothetical protein
MRYCVMHAVLSVRGAAVGRAANEMQRRAIGPVRLRLGER